MIVERVEQFVRDSSSGDFDELSRQAFRYQYDRLAPYRALCDRAGIQPDLSSDWRQIPVVPALAFKSLNLSTDASGEVFRSSGTTTDRPSVHRHAFPDLYRATIDASFPESVLGSTRPRPMLSLIPDRQHAPESSLAFMVEHVLQTWGAAGSVTAFGARGVEARRARSFLGASQRHQQPILILGTAFALVHLTEALQRFDLRFRLPPDSIVFETGGYKGRSREVPVTRLHQVLEEHLALPRGVIIREYGMTELTSQVYTEARHGGDPHLFRPPHWVRMRILDPETLAETSPGTPGLICIFDLANLSSAIHLLTEDLGVAEGNGIRLLGRAAGAELRGCSLAVEELERT